MDTAQQILDQLLAALRAIELLPDFDSARGIFCLIAWFATLLSLISLTVSLFVDFGADADADVSLGGDTGAFSLWAVIGFLLGLGWGGYVAVQCGFGTAASIGIGITLGAIMFFIVAGVMRLIYNLKSDGSLDYATLVGMTGSVYVTIPPHGEPGGQVQVSHPSQLVTMPAVQHGEIPLPAQTRIIVEEASTSQLVVRALHPHHS